MSRTATRVIGPMTVLGPLAVLFAIATGVGCAKPIQLGDPIAGLGAEERGQFERGRAVFERTFTPETGLGPVFNAIGCGECHEQPIAGGTGDEVETHVALVRPDKSCDPLAEKGGPVIQAHVTPALKTALGIDAEPAPEGVPQAHRTTPDIFGFGLLDAVPEKEILSRADPDDRDHDGISGRPNLDASGRVGRFGRKAQVALLQQFNADALLIEVGVTSPADPNESTVGGNPLPGGVDPAADPEIDAQTLADLQAFVRFLAPPQPLAAGPEARRGRGTFRRIGCAACHAPILRTAESPVDALAYKEIAAYTDLLLHDMGPDLADICLGLAEPSEFRTEPLMGLHLRTQFLHDGRAKTIDDAIRMHGGEASRARDRFQALDPKERVDLMMFLKTL